MKRTALSYALSSTFSALALAAAIGSSTSAMAQDCDRACLEGMVERYFDAVTDNNPAALPLAADARFTEDGQRLVIGDGLWNTMKAKGKYRLFVTDVKAQQVAVLATLYEDHRDPALSTASFIALRLRVENGMITEIEQVLARDENAAKRIEDMAVRPGLLATVPENKRMSRDEMVRISNLYFTGMQQNDGRATIPSPTTVTAWKTAAAAPTRPHPKARRVLILPLPAPTRANGAAWSNTRAGSYTSFTASVTGASWRSTKNAASPLHLPSSTTRAVPPAPFRRRMAAPSPTAPCSPGPGA